MAISSSRPGDDPHRLLAVATRYTQRGVRSTQDVLAHLRRAGASAGTAARVVVECRSRGIVDDRACAQLWADHWARRDYAWSAIRLKLSEKGLDAQTIDTAAHKLGNASQDEARARHAVTDAQRRSSSRSTPHQADRLARTLASRGFDSDLIERILNDTFGPRG